MRDIDEDTLLGQHLSGDPPRDAFKKQTLRDSTAALIRVQRLRSAWRRAGLAAAAVLIAGVAFLGGRLSAPSALPTSVVAPPVAAEPGPSRGEPEGVTVSSELVAWLEAANLFRQLGMEDRMARAIDRARRLLPTDTATANGLSGQVFAAGGSVKNQETPMEPMRMPGPHPSAENVNQILAQSFGD
jgi:hypothetical protein